MTLPDLSIKNKLIALILLVSFFAVGAGFTFIIVNDVQSFKKNMMDNTVMNAKLIGEYSVTPLAFGDKAGEEDLLKKLQTIPEIMNGNVYDNRGDLFAAYNRKGGMIVPPALVDDFCEFSGKYLHVIRPVIYKGEKYGKIYLRASTELLTEKINNYLLMILLLVTGIMFLSYLLALKLQKVLSEPILRLAEVTRKISDEGDYSVRVTRSSGDEIGMLYDGFNDMLDQINIREEALKKNELRLTNAQRVANIGDWSWDVTTDTITWSDEMYQICGVNKDTYLPEIKTFSKLLHPDDRPTRLLELLRLSVDKKNYDMEYRIIDQTTNAIKNIYVRGETSFGPDGKPVLISGIFQDITARKQAEEKIKASLAEKEMLLKEIHHRVKNNMQIISSLLRLQSDYVFDERDLDMFNESYARIQSMALIHEKLYQADDLASINFGEYIKEIVDNLVRTYSIEQNISVEIETENIKLGLDTAIPCGLLVNELVTNSLKHAFPEDYGQGKISIVLGKVEGNRLKLIVSDNGTGIPEGLDIKKSKSLGLRLVSILAEGQLRGALTLDTTIGTSFEIIFTGA